MLYRAVGHVLFVQSFRDREGDVLTRIRPPRERLEARQARKPCRPCRGAATPEASASPAPDRPATPRRPGPVDLNLRMGLWRRVSHWWTFSADQLDAIVGIS